MKDGPVRWGIKRLALWHFQANLWAWRVVMRLRGQRPYQLAGSCEGCARCCEAPSIAVTKLTWYLPTLRRLFLGWHRIINGFELVERVREGRVFVFCCTHFDPKTRQCDSYTSRPGMCRDYPRALLWQPHPVLFEGCGFRPRSPDAVAMIAELEAQGVEGERLADLKRRLFLE